MNTLHQKGVEELRPSDQFMLIQNGRQKLMPVQTVIEWASHALQKAVHVFFNNVKSEKPVCLFFAGNVAGGQVQFNLTDDGTPAGAALISTLHYVDAVVSDANNLYAYSAALSADKKLLTLTVNRLALALGVLLYQAAPNGTTVRLEVHGD